MKKAIILCLLATTLSMAEKHLRLGFIAGLGFPYYNPDIISTIENDFHFGVTSHVPIGFMGLEASMLSRFNIVTIKHGNGNLDYDELLFYNIESPIFLRYYFNDKHDSFYVGAGIKLGLSAFGAHNDFRPSNYDLSLALGGGWQWKPFFLSFKWYMPVTDFYEYRGINISRGGLFLEIGLCYTFKINDT